MWTILKFDKKRLNFLKSDLSKKLGKETIFYQPKLKLKRFKKNKLKNYEFDILGDYIFCFHKNFEKNNIYDFNFCRGLKYFLNGYKQYQEDINKFIKKCKKYENEEGYVSKTFFDLNINSYYKFSSGPFTDQIFKIVEIQKNKINILLGKVKTTINKDRFLFSRA
tara:strand:- start:626 stop:1120 length:495 start_codon:yes stop_codon:yes gene_type:complete